MYEKGLLEVKTDQKTDHFGKKVRFPDFRRQTGPKYQLCLPVNIPARSELVSDTDTSQLRFFELDLVTVFEVLVMSM